MKERIVLQISLANWISLRTLLMIDTGNREIREVVFVIEDDDKTKVATLSAA